MRMDQDQAVAGRQLAMGHRNRHETVDSATKSSALAVQQQVLFKSTFDLIWSSGHGPGTVLMQRHDLWAERMQANLC